MLSDQEEMIHTRHSSTDMIQVYCLLQENESKTTFMLIQKLLCLLTTPHGDQLNPSLSAASVSQAAAH